MKDIDYDLCIIGGGINGAGIARDASGRGMKVLLLEQGDLAQGTSSASTKLIHGGLRYLEFYEFGLVRASLKEREVLLNLAPHIIWPLEFVLPHHKDIRPIWVIRAGLYLYDFLAGKGRLKKSKYLDLGKHEYGAPLKNKFSKGFSYFDCWVQDARLVVLNAMDAKARGADILTRHKCTGLSCDGKIWNVDYEDLNSGQKKSIKASMVVNATGPWVEKFLKGSDFYTRDKKLPHLKLVKGSHIVVPRKYDGHHSYILQQKDGRIVFAIPFEHNFTLIGTTDENFEGDANDAKISDEEISYLCKAYNEFFEHPISVEDISYTYSGVRGLLDDGAEDARAITRDYKIYFHDGFDAPLLSIFGGKITTYRKLSEHVVNDLEKFSETKHGPWTNNVCLPGGDIQDALIDNLFAEYSMKYQWLPLDLVCRYVWHYGTRTQEIIGDAQSLDDLGEHYGDHVYEAEIRYLVENEFVRTSEDILLRRTKLALRISNETKKNIEAALQKQLKKAAA